MTGTKTSNLLRFLPPCAGALLAAALVAGCGRSQPGDAVRESDAGNEAAAAAPGQEGRQGSGGGAFNQLVRPPAQPPADPGEDGEERRGSTRQARCQIDDEPERPCAFTPVFGDGSFDIEMPDRQLRLIVSGEEAAPFELIGARRIPLAGLLRRDPQDRACWIAEEAELGLERVCAR